MADLISQLEVWYADRCVPGIANHHGFQIANVAEGGWWLRVDMPVDERNQLQSVLKPLHRSIDESSETWIQYSFNDGAFIGGCAPGLLDKLLAAFLLAASQIEPNVT